jgi:HrpA-like RNA helicase
MTEFPLAPRHSRIIVEAILRYPKVIEETITAAAFLSTQSPYVLPPGEEMDARRAHHRFRDNNGDFVSYLKLYRSYLDSANKQTFCEKNYLDERAMAEIANVTVQLEEIVSDLKIPILAGGSTEEYLCCIGRGLIQFVCVREGGKQGGLGSTYRSLTADRIMIHPGSVMFKRREEVPGPRYIVAGEIVRTTRMYAMSVSPLTPEILGQISPMLLSDLGGPSGIAGAIGIAGAGDTGQEERKRRRDFTNNIKLGNELFTIETIKGKKHVILPWEKLKLLKESGAETIDADQYRRLRGIITIKEHTLLAGEKLSLILTLLPILEPAGAFERKWPRKTTYYSAEADSLILLINCLPQILLPTVTSGHSDKKELGFIALFTNGNGSYWFRCSRGFHTAMNESIASLESLIDELGEDVDITIKHEVNQSYRRLADLLNG